MKENNTCFEQPPGCSHSLWWTLRNTGCEKHKMLPQTAEIHVKGICDRHNFSEPRLLHLPIHRKVLNSLTWDIWFSLIHKTFLIFRLLALYYKLLYNLTPFLHFLRTVLSGSLEVLSPRLNVLKIVLNKTTLNI